MVEMLVMMEVLKIVEQVLLHHSLVVLVVMVHKLYILEQMKYLRHLAHLLLHLRIIIFQQHGHLIL